MQGLHSYAIFLGRACQLCVLCLIVGDDASPLLLSVGLHDRGGMLGTDHDAFDFGDGTAA